MIMKGWGLKSNSCLHSILLIMCSTGMSKLNDFYCTSNQICLLLSSKQSSLQSTAGLDRGGKRQGLNELVFFQLKDYLRENN